MSTRAKKIRPDAAEIHGACLAARLPDRAENYIASRKSLETIRRELLDVHVSQDRAIGEIDRDEAQFLLICTETELRDDYPVLYDASTRSCPRRIDAFENSVPRPIRVVGLSPSDTDFNVVHSKGARSLESALNETVAEARRIQMGQEIISTPKLRRKLLRILAKHRTLSAEESLLKFEARGIYPIVCRDLPFMNSIDDYLASKHWLRKFSGRPRNVAGGYCATYMAYYLHRFIGTVDWNWLARTISTHFGSFQLQMIRANKVTPARENRSESRRYIKNFIRRHCTWMNKTRRMADTRVAAGKKARSQAKA